MTVGELTKMGPARATHELTGLAREALRSNNRLAEAAVEGGAVVIELCVLGCIRARQYLTEDRDYQRRMQALSAEAGQQG